MKCLVSKVVMNGQCRAGRRAFWDSVSCRKYTEVSNCVVRGVQYRTDYFSKNVRATFKKPSSGPRKRYELSLCIAVHPSRLLAGAEFGWKICEV